MTNGFFKENDSVWSRRSVCLALLIATVLVSSGSVGAQHESEILPELVPAERSLAEQKQIAVHGLFTDGMVLQRDMPVPVWGWGPEGVAVMVEFAGQRKTAVVDFSNHWKILLDPMSASSKPRKMTISSTLNSELKTLNFLNVLVGDVWLCTGQSNMQVSMKLDVKRYPPRGTDIEAVANQLVRFFKVDPASSQKLRRDVPPVQDNIYTPWANSFLNNQWRFCTPEWVPHVSAAAFYFARELQPVIGCPLGIVISARGGTAIDKWVPAGSIQAESCWEYQRGQLDDAKSRWDQTLAPHIDAWSRFRQAYPDLRTLWLAQKADRSIRLPPEITWPSCFYNGMIHPLAPFAVKGVLWYQGEGDVGNPRPYEDKLTDLITSWRALWSQDDLPFVVAQLAGFDRFGGRGAELRDAQARVADRVPNVYLATLIDTGMHQNIHPVRKDIAGERLARVALKEIYRQPVEAYGPVLQFVEDKGDGLLLTFSHTSDGLEAREVDLDGTHLSEGVLKGFTVAGEDDRYIEAQAKIQSDSRVFVFSEQVHNPVSVRYAWADFPEANLYNSSGLPAAPFQSKLKEGK